MRQHIVVVFKVLWIALTTSVLLLALYYFDGKPNSDADILLGFGMVILSFPLGWLLSVTVSLLGKLVYYKFGYIFEASYLSIFMTWLCLFIVGYWQWFTAIPWVFRRTSLKVKRR
jgi:hypothetical protein